MIKSVAFDLDGTLLNRSESIRHYCDYFVLQHLDWFENHNDTTLTTDRMYTLYRDSLSKTPEYYATVIDQFNWVKRPDPEYLDRHYRECMITFCIPQNNVYTTLRALKSMGITFGIITNGVSMHQTHKIERLNLHQVVDMILISSDCGYKKPDAEIFEAYCSEMRVKPEETLFVGDDAMRDIWGAASVGMHTAWFSDGRPWKHQDFEPERIIDDLIESITFIQHLKTSSESAENDARSLSFTQP